MQLNPSKTLAFTKIRLKLAYKGSLKIYYTILNPTPLSPILLTLYPQLQVEVVIVPSVTRAIRAELIILIRV